MLHFWDIPGSMPLWVSILSLSFFFFSLSFRGMGGEEKRQEHMGIWNSIHLLRTSCFKYTGGDWTSPTLRACSVFFLLLWLGGLLGLKELTLGDGGTDHQKVMLWGASFDFLSPLAWPWSESLVLFPLCGLVFGFFFIFGERFRLSPRFRWKQMNPFKWKNPQA